MILRLRQLRASFDPTRIDGPSNKTQPTTPHGDGLFECSAGAAYGGDGGGSGRVPNSSAADPWVSRDHVCVCIGVDEDDKRLRERLAEIESVFEGLDVRVVTFAAADLRARPPGPVCWMWGVLAQEAVRVQHATHFVLLGDDTRMTPVGWPRDVLRTFAATNGGGGTGGGADSPAHESTAPSPAGAADAAASGPAPPLAPPSPGWISRRRRPLRCLVLMDAADPGYPSFPVIASEHLQVFGALFPEDLFVNQMGDPFLAELHRRLGGLGLAADVTVHNGTGGIQLPDDDGYVPPRYTRTYPPLEQLLRALEEWTARGAAAWGPGPTTVDVLVPCGRANPGAIRRIVEACSRGGDDCGHGDDGLAAPPDYDVRFGCVVDAADPAHLPADLRAEIGRIRDEHVGRMRLRFNGANMGASCTRNRLMDESLAQILVLLDGDVEPLPGCVAAYVRAAREHPEAQGFVGPTFLPSAGSVWAHAVHMSDVTFFWSAPANETIRRRPDGSRYLPWAVTANLAVRNTAQRFNERFPRTGGGEDIDFCLRACPGWLLAVPQAACRHPIWGNGRPDITRFGRWAVGDGRLISMYPRLTYRAAPNACELLLPLLLLALTAAAAAFMTTATAAAATTAKPRGTLRIVLRWVAPAAALCGCWWQRVAAAAAAAAMAVAASELALELVRHVFNRARLARHPCPSWSLRLRAAVIAAAVRNVSEAGRLYGHVTRAMSYPGAIAAGVTADGAGAGGGEGGAQQQGGGVRRILSLYGKRFDWFCGLDRSIVRMEQLRAAVRCAVHVSAGAWAAAAALAATAPPPPAGLLRDGATLRRPLAAAFATVFIAACAVVTWRE
ncbi:hypothetical protein GPECTOR_45g103 [Gonium pectorale]|uniref:Uncharacterized protein n=1 Tax=Gonium pectorale TaxID=33097 RepID=A0A150G8Y8_GONPE|nr:hypothetical protein GPECTOR_45g103 [Gonium pectorale]|eukprot:KXZ46233.1 hypothetical protein GPECTOR_45g103 [Gonium pectorale]